jgi:hypothetical protein
MLCHVTEHGRAGGKVVGLGYESVNDEVDDNMTMLNKNVDVDLEANMTDVAMMLEVKKDMNVETEAEVVEASMMEGMVRQDVKTELIYAGVRSMKVVSELTRETRICTFLVGILVEKFRRTKLTNKNLGST